MLLALDFNDTSTKNCRQLPHDRISVHSAINCFLQFASTNSTCEFFWVKPAIHACVVSHHQWNEHISSTMIVFLSGMNRCSNYSREQVQSLHRVKWTLECIVDQKGFYNAASHRAMRFRDTQCSFAPHNAVSQHTSGATTLSWSQFATHVSRNALQYCVECFVRSKGLFSSLENPKPTDSELIWYFVFEININRIFGFSEFFPSRLTIGHLWFRCTRLTPYEIKVEIFKISKISFILKAL